MANGEILAYKRPPVHLVDNSGMLEEVKDDGPGFWQRQGLNLRVLTMDKPTKPYWNTTMVTAWVAVIGLIVVMLGAIGSLYVYTTEKSVSTGIDIGTQRERDRATQEKLKEQNIEIETLKRAAGLLPPSPTPTPERSKK